METASACLFSRRWLLPVKAGGDAAAQLYRGGYETGNTARARMPDHRARGIRYRCAALPLENAGRVIKRAEFRGRSPRRSPTRPGPVPPGRAWPGRPRRGSPGFRARLPGRALGAHRDRRPAEPSSAVSSLCVRSGIPRAGTLTPRRGVPPRGGRGPTGRGVRPPRTRRPVARTGRRAARPPPVPVNRTEVGSLRPAGHCVQVRHTNLFDAISDTISHHACFL